MPSSRFQAWWRPAQGNRGPGRPGWRMDDVSRRCWASPARARPSPWRTSSPTQTGRPSSSPITRRSPPSSMASSATSSPATRSSSLSATTTTTSPRTYPEILPAIEYGPDDTVVRVKWDGKFRAFGRSGKVSNALTGFDIALRPASQSAEGVYDLFFCHQRIGKLDLRKAEK